MSNEEEISFIHDMMNKITIIQGKTDKVKTKNQDENLTKDLEKASNAIEALITLIKDRRSKLD